jgi:hypothetical protein
MASETLVKCAHPPCECLVERQPKFCSSACSGARATARAPLQLRPSPCTAGESFLGDESSQGTTA